MLSEAVWRLLGRDSGTDECHMLPVTGPWQPVGSYKAIQSLWVLLLGLGVGGME